MVDDAQARKRNRLSLSCNYCKKRKVKCDRGRPCSSCVRYNVANLCEYSDPIWLEPVAITGNAAMAATSNQNSRKSPQSHSLSAFHVNGSSNSPHTSSHSHSSNLPSFSVQRFHPPAASTKPPQANGGVQTSFHVPPPGPSNHSGNHSSRGTASHQDPSLAAPAVQSELETLKNKIKEIEASLKPQSSQHNHNQHNHNLVDHSHNSRSVHTSTNSFSSQPSLSTANGNVHNRTSPEGSLSSASSNSSANAIPYSYLSGSRPTGGNGNLPIQLPPLQWTHNADRPDVDYTGRPQYVNRYVLKFEDFKYNPDKNPTFIGINPFSADDDLINLYEGYTPIHIRDASRRMNYGPFAWLSIMKKDPGLLSLWKFMMSKKHERHLAIQRLARTAPAPELGLLPEKEPEQTSAPADSPKGADDQEKIFREKAIDRDGFNDLRLYGNVAKASDTSGNLKEKIHSGGYSKVELHNPKAHQKTQMNKLGIALGLTMYEGQIGRELELIEKIKMILPKQKVIWKLINKFFKSVYPYMPFIDENYFKLEMARILGPEAYSDSRLGDLKIEKRLDLAQIGILLIILRISYLSLFSNRRAVNQNNLNSNDPAPPAIEMKYLLSNPINIDVIDVAQLCLDQFELLRKSSLVILQCAYFMRLYHMFSPEDGDGADGGDSQIFNGMLVQMAYSMGINREPDTFPDICNDEKVNNLGRKIWFFLIINDLIQAYQYGNPLTIREKYYDTKLPYYKKGNENISDVSMEQHVISTFAYFEKYYYRLTAILDICLDIRKKVKVSQLSNLMGDFEHHLNDHYGTLRYFLVPFQQDNYVYPFLKTMKCKNYINMKGFLLTIYFHMYLYYESKKKTDFAYFYVKKIFATTCGEFVPSFFPLITNNYINFGETADLILNPTIESMIHKTTQMNFAILVRLNSTIYRMKHNANHGLNLRDNFGYKLKFAKLCKLSKILEKIIKFCIAAMSRLSQRYYYAWRVTKAHTFLLKMIIGEEFYKYCQDDEQIIFLDLSNDQLNELTEICEVTLKKFGKTKIFHAASELFDDINNEDIEAPVLDGANSRVSVSSTPQAAFDGTNGSEPNAAHMAGVINVPSSVDSIGSADMDDFQFIENVEIDKLWYQMASIKNENNNNSNSNTNTNNNSTGKATGSAGLFNFGLNVVSGSSAQDDGPFKLPGQKASVVDPNPAEGGSTGYTPMNLSIPTPLMNPLSPESLNTNSGGQPSNAAAEEELTTADFYSIDIFNNLPIDQLLGFRDEVDESW